MGRPGRLGPGTAGRSPGGGDGGGAVGAGGGRRARRAGPGDGAGRPDGALRPASPAGAGAAGRRAAGGGRGGRRSWWPCWARSRRASTATTWPPRGGRPAGVATRTGRGGAARPAGWPGGRPARRTGPPVPRRGRPVGRGVPPVRPVGRYRTTWPPGSWSRWHSRSGWRGLGAGAPS
ncbi:hypothetical protein LUW75_19340 [Streptomyces sp. MRC013]|nr:hypothetical protein LUW75_19340 [Streptomyces sp. MRC013]